MISKPQPQPSSSPLRGSQLQPWNTPHTNPSEAHSSPVPFLCRRPVRLTLYGALGAFALWMLAWGFLPALLDPTFEKHLQDKKIMVGMTREQVMQAWGSPYQMNVSHTSKGVRREEWVYEDWKDTSTFTHRYLYFEEGILMGGWYYE